MNFETLLPTFPDKIAEFYRFLYPVAISLCFGGVLFGAYRGMFGDLGSMMRKMISVGVIGVILSQFPEWVLEVQNDSGPQLIEELDADPWTVHKQFGGILNNVHRDADDGKGGVLGFFDKVSQPGTAIASAIGWLALWIVGKIAWIIMFYGFLIQKVVLYFGIALAPVFLPLFLLESTKGIGTRYVMGIIGILSWPLGWGLASLLTGALIDSAIDNSVLVLEGGRYIYNWQLLLFVMYAGIWIIFSTIFAPIVMMKAITTGAQIGTGLVGAVGGGTASAAGAAVGMAATGGGSAAAGGSAGSSVGGGGGSSGGSMAGIAGGSSGGGGGSSDPVAEAKSIGSAQGA